MGVGGLKGTARAWDDLLRGAVLVHDGLVLDAVGLQVELDALGLEGVRESGFAVGHGVGWVWCRTEEVGGLTGLQGNYSVCRDVKESGRLEVDRDGGTEEGGNGGIVREGLGSYIFARVWVPPSDLHRGENASPHAHALAAVRALVPWRRAGQFFARARSTGTEYGVQQLAGSTNHPHGVPFTLRHGGYAHGTWGGHRQVQLPISAR